MGFYTGPIGQRTMDGGGGGGGGGEGPSFGLRRRRTMMKRERPLCERIFPNKDRTKNGEGKKTYLYEEPMCPWQKGITNLWHVL